MKTPYILLVAFIALFLYGMIQDVPPAAIETDELIVINYWEKWTGFEGEAMKATVDKFNEKKIKNKKGQVIQVKYLPVAEVDRKALLATAGGVPPDIGGGWARQIPVWADLDGLMPLDDLIKRDNFDMKKYIPVYRGMCEHRGKTWALTTTPATVALHWNKELFREVGLDPEVPPKSLKELEEFAAKITKRDDKGKFVRVGFLPIEPGWFNWAFGYWWGGKLNDGESRITTAGDPKNIEAWKWICKWGDMYGAEEMLTFKQSFGSFDSPQNGFMSGKVGMVIQGVWMANFIRFNNPHMSWGCAPFPSAFDNGGENVSVADADMIFIPRGSKHPEEAWEYIKFVNSHEGMEILCKGQGKLTPFMTTTDGWIEAHSHPKLQVFIDLAKSKNVVTLPRIAVTNQYIDELNAAFEQVWLGKRSPEEAFKAVDERMQPKNDKQLALILRRQEKKKGEQAK